MRNVTDSEAQGLLGELLDFVEQGESITITRHGVPVAVLRPPPEIDRKKVAEAIERIKEGRKGTRLDGISIRELIEEGRQY